MTRYYYPTWADIIGRQFDYYENWGRPGAGNLYILNSVMECHQRNQLCADDFVVIVWSGLSRIDSYQINEWSHFHGRILDQKSQDIPVSCVDGYEIISYAYISAMKNILENINVPFFMFHATHYDDSSRAGKFYKNILKSVPEFCPERNTIHYPRQADKAETNKIISDLYDRLSGPDWPTLECLLSGNFQTNESIQREIEEFFMNIKQDSRINFNNTDKVDGHPLPTQHLAAVIKNFPDIRIPESDQLWIKDIEAKVLAGEPYDFNRHLPKSRL